MRSPEIISVLAQRGEVAEKYISEAQGLIRSGKNAGAVLRKLQAARNVLLGHVEDTEQAPPEIAAASIEPENTPSMAEIAAAMAAGTAKFGPTEPNGR